MPQKVLINFSDAQVAQLGACKTQADFQAAVDLAIEASGAPKTEQKVVLLEDVQKLFAGNLKAFTDSVASVEGKVAAVATSVASVNPENLLKEARAAASVTAAETLGQVGATAAGAAKTDANEGNQNSDRIKELEAVGKHEDVWATSESLQAEFTSAKAYAAFKRAEKAGSVKIFKPKQ